METTKYTIVWPISPPPQHDKQFTGWNTGSAWALNPGHPIEKPDTGCTGDVENHFADFNFDVILSSFHRESPSGLCTYFKLTHRLRCVNQNPLFTCFYTGFYMAKNSKVFDIIVLAGMVVNIILAVFLILYYFDFL